MPREKLEDMNHPAGCMARACWEDAQGVQWHPGTGVGVYAVTPEDGKVYFFTRATLEDFPAFENATLRKRGKS